MSRRGLRRTAGLREPRINEAVDDAGWRCQAKHAAERSFGPIQIWDITRMVLTLSGPQGAREFLAALFER
jgi:aspartyl-tRNA synthetase